MKKKTVYWVPKIGILAILSALFMACSAAARLIWTAGEAELPRSILWFQVYLPLLANVAFIVILFRDGKERLYRSAIPVWLGCVFFAVKSLHFSSMIHTVLCLLLYALVAVLYTATVTGYVPTRKLLWPLFGLPLLYHIFVEDTQKIGWPLHDWLPEVSVLCCMASLLLVSLAMEKRPVEEGTYLRRFGDRNDGRRLRGLSPIFAVSPYIMKTRNTSQNFIEDHIEVTEMERYITEKRKAGMKYFGVLHVLLAAYVRTCARYPGLNRFIAGQKIFTRDREIEVNMTIKKEMSADSPDTVIKVHLNPRDTADEVYRKLQSAVDTVKNTPLDSNFDSTAGAFTLIPGVLLKFVVWLLKALDYFGMLPKFLLEVSPFHGSLFFTSMGSLGIPPIYHHLYDFGNLPVFGAFGMKRRANEVLEDGTVVQRKYVDVKFVLDERIVDGYYYAAFFKHYKRILQHPEVLDRPPEEVLQDID